MEPRIGLPLLKAPVDLDRAECEAAHYGSSAAAGCYRITKRRHSILASRGQKPDWLSYVQKANSRQLTLCSTV